MNNDLSLISLFQHIDSHILTTSALQKVHFERFLNLLIEWNSKINLISRNEKNIIDRHFLNSICVAHFVKFQPDDKILDLGSGGGFPAIILKILFPQSYFVVTDSVTKKTEFLKHVVRALDLQKIDVVNDRIEKISSVKHFRTSFDYVTARAVTSLKNLVGLSQPFLKQNGKMVFLKGRSYAEELDGISIEPGKMKLHPLHSIAHSQDGVLLVISVD